MYLTSFVGREAEVAEAVTLLSNHRLVTILGAGGTGKTRLACAIATAPGLELGQLRFLDLARVTSPQYLALQVAAALGSQQRRKTRLHAGSPASS